jgi:hypothetical protein
MCAYAPTRNTSRCGLGICTVRLSTPSASSSPPSCANRCAISPPTISTTPTSTKLIKIELIEAGPRILLALPERLAAASADLLRRVDVTIRAGTPVTSVNADGVTLKSGEFVPAELIVWAAGIMASEFLRDLDGLEADRINREAGLLVAVQAASARTLGHRQARATDAGSADQREH